jgi:hypothetical protein
VGVFRTLRIQSACLHCKAAFASGVQFKTGDDWEMPEHAEGDVVHDVQPGVYEGLADAYCAYCFVRWVAAEGKAHFAAIANDVQSGLIVARRSERAGADGVTDLAAPMSAAEIRALPRARDRGGWPSIGARLHEEGLTLSAGGTRVFPPDFSSPSDTWWSRQSAEVGRRLRDLGWPTGWCAFVDAVVEVDADHRIRARR